MRFISKSDVVFYNLPLFGCCLAKNLSKLSLNNLADVSICLWYLYIVWKYCIGNIANSYCLQYIVVITYFEIWGQPISVKYFGKDFSTLYRCFLLSSHNHDKPLSSRLRRLINIDRQSRRRVHHTYVEKDTWYSVSATSDIHPSKFYLLGILRACYVILRHNLVLIGQHCCNS